MSAPDDLDGPDLSGVGWLNGWSPLSPEERRDALMADAAQVAAEKRRDQRKRLAHEIATIKVMQKAGLAVRAATIDGVKLEFGQAEPAPPAEIEIETPEQLRRLI